MSDVFVSYKAEDRARLAPLVQALQTDGLSVWWDEHIGGGDDWRDTILRQLEAAKCVIVVWSKRSVGPQGSFVRDEATRALRRHTYLPVRIDKVEPPLGFGETQALDLRGWKGDRADPRYQAVIAAVRTRLGIAQTDAPLRRHHAGNSRRTVLISAGAFGAAAIAGAGAWLFTRSGTDHGDSIAVLPFANLSGDPAQVYFSDGIAEELRSALSRITGLKVVARTSSETVRNDDARSAAHKLGVSHILTGSVRRSPQLIRVSAQLVDASGLEQWTAAYDRPAGDSLQIQSDIATNVAQALSLRLGERPSDFRDYGGTDNPEAQDLLLRATAMLKQADSEPGMRQALSLIDSALAIDPKYGAAVTAKTDLLSNLGGTFAKSASDWRAIIGQAEQTGKQAVALAPRLPAAYLALGIVYYWTFRFRPALQQFDKMQGLPGNTAHDYSTLAFFIGGLGRSAEALALTNQAVALDPLNPGVYTSKAGQLLSLGRYSEAEETAETAMRLGPALIEPRIIRARILLRAGKTDEAEKAVAGLEDSPGAGQVVAAEIAERRGDRATSNRLLRQMCKSDASQFQCAQIYAVQSRKDEAIEALEKAWLTGDPGLAQMQGTDEFGSLRDDPRYQAIVRRMNFPT